MVLPWVIKLHQDKYLDHLIYENKSFVTYDVVVIEKIGKENPNSHNLVKNVLRDREVFE